MTGNSKIILLEADSGTTERIQEGFKPLLNESITMLTDTEAFLHQLKENELRPNVVLIGKEASNPLETAQKVHSVDQELSIFILSDPDQRGPLEKSLLFSPFLGDAVYITVPQEESDFFKHVSEEVAAVEQRKAYKTMVAGSVEKLNESKARVPDLQHLYLDKLLDYAPIGIISTDSEGRVIAWNNFARRVTEVPEREILGVPFQSLFPVTTQKLIRESMAETLATGKAKSFSVERPDGETQYLELSVVSVQGDQGQNHFLFTMQDISRRVELEKALENNARQFMTFAEAMPQMAFIADSQGEITYFNQRFYDYVGLGRETTGSGWKNYPIHHPDDFQRTIDRWTDSLKTGRPYEIEYRLRRHDGSYRWHLGRALPVKDTDGNVIQWLGTNTDIHDQKEIEEKLENMVRSRDEFLSIASHELNTPLTSLNLQVQLFKRDLSKNREQAFAPERIIRLVDQAEKQTARLIRLVDDMLDISRIRSGKLSIKPEELNLCDLVTDVIERLSPLIKEKDVEINLDCDSEIRGRWDKLRLEQVITNLLTNALRYGENKPVHIILNQNDGQAFLSVKDEGLGITEEALGRIFNRFEREATSKDIAGLGLGLFITREIIEAHGGKIWAHSEGLGRGSTFYIQLPLKKAPEKSHEL